MRLYLTRIRHTTGVSISALASLTKDRCKQMQIGLSCRSKGLRGLTGEGFLLLALRYDRVGVHRLPGWALCLHTQLALGLRSGFRGCIGRVRCRSPCSSLVCRYIIERRPRSLLHLHVISAALALRPETLSPFPAASISRSSFLSYCPNMLVLSSP